MAEERTLRSEIRKKLREYGSDTDGLAEYIAVMVGNKRDRKHVLSDLELFLTPNHKKFVDWLFNISEEFLRPQDKESKNTDSDGSKHVDPPKSTSLDEKKSTIRRTSSKSKQQDTKPPTFVTKKASEDPPVSKDRRLRSSSRSINSEPKIEKGSEKADLRKSSVLKKTIADAILSKPTRNSKSNKTDVSISAEAIEESKNPKSLLDTNEDSSTELPQSSAKKRNLIALNDLPESKPLKLKSDLPTIAPVYSDLRDLLNKRRRSESVKITEHSNLVSLEAKSLIRERTEKFTRKEVEKNPTETTMRKPITSVSNLHKKESQMPKETTSGIDTVQGNILKITPSVTSNAKRRCKFWPSCKDVSTCPFYHPSVNCTSFPACKFGDQCLYIHPLCNFNDSCLNRKCTYLHTKKPVLNIPQNSVKPTTECRFGEACSKPACPYRHPTAKTNGDYQFNIAKTENSLKKKENLFKWKSEKIKNLEATPLQLPISQLPISVSTEQKEDSTCMDFCD